ncbi:hypothetical protein WISP_104688 [Willisornis vidua]|uniref:Uncharacterized protein n=1 Tax=Willisornis vidua TaxID=1566151 RepID=A0ABQ9D1W8_9PASS|nr:hypothetical protein WISP_104688 [Willisornis vidua]
MIRDKLIRDGINLSKPPYSNKIVYSVLLLCEMFLGSAVGGFVPSRIKTQEQTITYKQYYFKGSSKKDMETLATRACRTRWNGFKLKPGQV